MHLNVLPARGGLLFLFGICLLLLDFVLQHVCHVLRSVPPAFGQILWAKPPLSPVPPSSLLLSLCSSEVLFEAHTFVEHGSRLAAVLFPLQRPQKPPYCLCQSENPPIFHFPAAPSSTRNICLVFARNQIFLCRQANKMALPARRKSRSRSANTKRQRRQKLRHVYKVLQ